MSLRTCSSSCGSTRRGSSPTRGSLRTWLGTLAHRRAVDHVRREEAKRRTAMREASRPAVAPDVEEMALALVTAERVRAALATLPDEQRDAIELAYFGGRTYREVAEVLGIPEGTARSRLRLGLKPNRRSPRTNRAADMTSRIEHRRRRDRRAPGRLRARRARSRRSATRSSATWRGRPRRRPRSSSSGRRRRGSEPPRRSHHRCSCARSIIEAARGQAARGVATRR